MGSGESSERSESTHPSKPAVLFFPEHEYNPYVCREYTHVSEIYMLRQIKLFLTRFFLLGMFGITLELAVTMIASFATNLFKGHLGVDIDACHTTTFFAMFVYGWAALPYDFLHKPLTALLNKMFAKEKKEVSFAFSLIGKGLIYGSVFSLIEYVCGAVSFYIFNCRAWDYTGFPLHTPDGLICLPVGLFWGVIGIAGEFIYAKVNVIDDIIVDNVSD